MTKDIRKAMCASSIFATSRFCAYSFRAFLEGIEELNVPAPKISNVPGHDDEIVHQRGRGYSGIISVLVRPTKQLPPLTSDCLIDREDAPLIGSEDCFGGFRDRIRYRFVGLALLFNAFRDFTDREHADREFDIIHSVELSRHILVRLGAADLLQDIRIKEIFQAQSSSALRSAARIAAFAVCLG